MTVCLLCSAAAAVSDCMHARTQPVTLKPVTTLDPSATFADVLQLHHLLRSLALITVSQLVLQETTHTLHQARRYRPSLLVLVLVLSTAKPWHGFNQSMTLTGRHSPLPSLTSCAALSVRPQGAASHGA